MTKRNRTGSYYYIGEDKMKQYSVFVPIELSEYVRKEAKEEYTNKSAYVRELIWQLMNGKIEFNRIQSDLMSATQKDSIKLSMNFNEQQYQFIADKTRELRMSKSQFFRNLILQDMQRRR